MTSPQRNKRGRASPAQAKVSTAKQQARQTAPRLLLLMTVVIALMASVAIWLAIDFSCTQYRKCGHIHLDGILTLLAFVLTTGFVWNLFQLIKGRKAQAEQPLIQGDAEDKAKARR